MTVKHPKFKDWNRSVGQPTPFFTIAINGILTQQMPRKQKILLGLLVALALALVYRLTNPFEQETVDRLPYARATRVTPPQSASASGTELHLALLESPPKHEITIQRDLFQPPKAAASSATTNTPQPSAPMPPPKTERDLVQDYFRNFKAFGSYRYGDEIYIFLERGKQVLIVTRGDRIDGKYTITDLTEKSITVTAKGLSQPLKIDFDEP